MNNLAWLLATWHQADIRNPQEAVRIAEQGCKITDYKNLSLLDTLAAAYAAAGRFDEAIATADRALELARLSQSEEMIKEMQDRMRLYLAGQAYIEPAPKASSN